MKIYIFCDLEGISGVSSKAYVSSDSKRPDLLAAGRQFMAHDINACVEGCFRAGANSVVVRDGHGDGLNLHRAQVDERVDLVSGATPGRRFGAFEGSSALILLGYHAMAGTKGALLEHTFSSLTIQNIWLNGKKAGEIAIDAAIAAEYSVPVIMVSGDDKACAEAEDWLPGVVSCEVKKSFSVNSALLYSLEKTKELIIQKTIEAINAYKKGEIKPLALEYPVSFRKEFVERMAPDLPERGNMRWIDGRTMEIKGDSVEQMLLGNY